MESLKREAVVYQARIAEIGRTLVCYKRQTDGDHGEKKGDDRIIVLWDSDYSGSIKNLSIEGFKLSVYIESEDAGQCMSAE
jgi:hypothetical protein